MINGIRKSNQQHEERGLALSPFHRLASKMTFYSFVMVIKLASASLIAYRQRYAAL